MIIKFNDTDISELLLSYSRSLCMTSIVGNAPVTSLELSLDNFDGVFSYDVIKDAVFEVQPTDTSEKYYFKAYEMPESWDGQIDLKLYDSLYNLDTAYKTSLDYPSTVQKQLDEMESITGIEIDYSQLDESILTRVVNQYDSTIAIRSYLRWIAEVGACNVLAGDEYGKAKFVKISQNNIVKTYDDLLDYKKGNPYSISKVSFNDGLHVFEPGTDEGNTYSLDAENPYITNESDIDIAAETLIGLSVYSATNIEADYTDNLQLGNIIKCIDFNMIVLSITEKYTGGTEPDLSLEGELTTENKEAIGQKITDKVRIKRLQVITNELDSSIQIIAKDQEDLETKQSQFQLSLDGVKTSVEQTTQEVTSIKNNITFTLVSNLTLSQTCGNNKYVPDYTVTPLIIDVKAVKDLLGNAVTNYSVEWKRLNDEDLIAGETVTNNQLKISHNLDESTTFVCTVTSGDFSSSKEITVTRVENGQNGEDGQDAITYQITSSLGTAFESSQEGTTVLTAHIYSGTEEVDADGALYYTWYLVDEDGNETVLGTGKSIEVDIQSIAGKGVYFVAGSEEAIGETYYWIDENGNILTDEKGNRFIWLESAQIETFYLLDENNNILTDENENRFTYQ